MEEPSPHRYLGVQERDDGYVATCTCGWESSVGRTAEDTSGAWDQHVPDGHKPAPDDDGVAPWP